MNINRRTVGHWLGALGLLLLASGVGSPAISAELKIGLDFSLTGGTDDAGRAARMGAELALEEYNARGGYQGQKVGAVIYDDETKPAKGVENVTRLITRDKVFAIVGPLNSGVALAIIDIAQKNQVPLMTTSPTAEQVIERYRSQPKSYIFRVSLNDRIQTSLIIDYAKKRNYHRIGLMHDSTGWGQSGRDTALRLLKEANLPVVAGPEVFDQNDTDMTAQLGKMKAANVDFIISYSLSPAGVQIAKSMQKIGMTTTWISTWALIAPNFLKLGGKDLIEGVMAVAPYTPDYSANSRALHAKVEERFKSEGGDFYPVQTAQAYDGVRLVLRALDKAGPNPQKIRDSLEEIDDFTEAVTKMKPHPFTKDNHEALGADSGFLVVWHDGKLVPVE
ncbi:MAG: ABC transporter substrate-binding protein [Acetobacteraceae bacterium]|nr:ABC transporter substrate-binding protein [Acetobacteraceae bacterium]